MLVTLAITLAAVAATGCTIINVWFIRTLYNNRKTPNHDLGDAVAVISVFTVSIWAVIAAWGGH